MHGNIYKYLKIPFFSLLLLISCHDHHVSKPSGIMIKNPQYDIYYDLDTDIYSVGNIKVKGLYKIDVKGANYILSSFEPYNANNKIILNGVVLQVGFDGIAASVATNLSGDYAYTVSQNSVAESFIVFNGSVLSGTTDQGLYNILDMSDNYLAVARSFPKQNTSSVYIYDLNNSMNVSEYAVPGCYPQKGVLTDLYLYVQMFCIDTMSQDVYSIDLIQKSIASVRKTLVDEILNGLVSAKDNTVKLSVVDGNKNGKYLFNAYYNLYLYQLGEPFSSAPDFLGRLSWNESYRLAALAGLYKKTGDKVLEKILVTSIANVLNSRSSLLGIEDSFNPGCGWAAKKYSIDKTSPNTLLVNDGMIMYGLMEACEALGDKCQDRLEIQLTAACLFGYYENHFDVAPQLYRIQYGSKFYLDGVWAPWNWQNIWAIDLLKMFEWTNDINYQKRALEILALFLNEQEIVNNKLLWRYWPNRFYAGWSATDLISMNTPTKLAQTPVEYEDVSHGYLNVLAMNYMNKYKTAPLEQLNNTLNGMMALNPDFPLFIDAGTSGSLANFPKFAWSQLNNADLKEMYVNMMPLMYPDFEVPDIIPGYVNYFDASSPVTINIEDLNCDQSQCKSICTYSYQNTFDFIQNNSFFNLTY